MISTKMETQICARMIAYSSVFVLAVVFGFVNLLYQVGVASCPFGFSLLVCVWSFLI